MLNKYRQSDQTADEIRNEALQYFTRYLPEADRERSRTFLENVIEHYGPVVRSYPHWHPLVTSGGLDHSSPSTIPGDRCGYRGLDHTRFLRNGIITCPYHDKSVYDSVRELKVPSFVKITAEPFDAPLYHPKAKPILIKCNWDGALASDGSIPAAMAVPLLLETELPCWRDSQVAETWKTMHGYILGQPCGLASSLFVNQETGQKLKAIWNTLINTGMFGPIRVG